MSFRTALAVWNLLFASSVGAAEESRFLTAKAVRNDIVLVEWIYLMADDLRPTAVLLDHSCSCHLRFDGDALLDAQGLQRLVEDGGFQLVARLGVVLAQ